MVGQGQCNFATRIVHYASLICALLHHLSAAPGSTNTSLWFYDDFQRPNTAYGVIGTAPFISPFTGEQPAWFYATNFTPVASNRYSGFITNGLLTFAYDTWPTGGINNPQGWANYPVIDLGPGAKPSWVGARIKWIPGKGTYGRMSFVLLSFPSLNGIGKAFHIGLNRVNGGIGLWDGGIIELGAGTIQFANGIPINREIDFEYFVDGNLITVNFGGRIYQVNDPRVSQFGGRYIAFEPYSDDAGIQTDRVQVIRVWAGANPQPPVDSDQDGVSDYQEYLAGTNPADPKSLFTVTTTNTGAALQVSFLARQVAGTNYLGMSRKYSLERSAGLGGAWTEVPGYANILGTNQTVTHTSPCTNGTYFFRAKVWLQNP